jgi:hypothetical protein
MRTIERRPPRFCPDCGEPLPSLEARFCIGCGRQFAPVASASAAPDPPAAIGPTVQLPNARSPQQVIGGTVRLPSSGAIPPGLWVQDEPPGPADIVAIYAPLRAVVGGWSGLRGRGWKALDAEAQRTEMYFRFVANLIWFPAAGCGGGMRLHIQIEARSSAQEGRERHGFRYNLQRSGPMHVSSAVWHDTNDQPLPHVPLPQIQIMAPPRVRRISDYDDVVDQISRRDGVTWAGDTRAPGLFRLYSANVLAQEHTPAGRGITLIPQPAEQPERQGWLQLIFTPNDHRYRLRVTNPFQCPFAAWQQQHLPHLRSEARQLGLDLEPATAAEWWLDRYGYDAVHFTAAETRFKTAEVIIVFRRNQIAYEKTW